MPAKSRSNELTLTRVYDAPVAAVWEAWTDPAQTAKWWGPRGFTLTTHSKDLKTGGHWHYTMHGPDGTDYANKTTYLEVDAQKRLVYDHGANDHQPPIFRVTVTFKSIGKKTQMEMTMACPSPEQAEQTRKFIKLAGGNATWDRLAEYLEKESARKEVFVINRSFDARIEDVLEKWVNPNHFAQWLGPDDTKMEYLSSEIAEGKTTFYKMAYGTGLVMFGKMTYSKIEKPRLLEYTQIFCDENGNLTKHPNVPVWPDRISTQVFFSEEHDGQTRVTLIWQPHAEFSEKELNAFIEMKPGMSQGWTEAFDKLENMFVS